MKLLERIFRRLLWESQLSGEELSAKIPARIERAIKEKIALAQVKLYGDLNCYVLYKPAAPSEAIIEYVKSGKRIMEPIIRQSIGPVLKDSIVGMVAVMSTSGKNTYGPCDGADIVKLAAVDQGFGPMLYDIAMSLSSAGKITADRDAVSDYALDIWKGMNKRGDIEKKQFINKDAPEEEKRLKRAAAGMEPDDDSADCTVWEPTHPDRKFLDNSFKKTSTINIEVLQKGHDSFIKLAQDALDWVTQQREAQGEYVVALDAASVISLILSMEARSYFADRYSRIPQSTVGYRFPIEIEIDTSSLDRPSPPRRATPPPLPPAARRPLPPAPPIPPGTRRPPPPMPLSRRK